MQVRDGTVLERRGFGAQRAASFIIPRVIWCKSSPHCHKPLLPLPFCCGGGPLICLHVHILLQQYCIHVCLAYMWTRQSGRKVTRDPDSRALGVATTWPRNPGDSATQPTCNPGASWSWPRSESSPCFLPSTFPSPFPSLLLASPPSPPALHPFRLPFPPLPAPLPPPPSLLPSLCSFHSLSPPFPPTPHSSESHSLQVLSPLSLSSATASHPCPCPLLPLFH
jgi:hypothetical protein